MRFRLPVLFLVFGVVPVCRGQISNSCKAYIDPVINRAVQQLQEANARSDAGERTQGINASRTAFRQSLVNATLMGACLGGLGEKQFAGILELRKIDKQVGASNGASGSTSPVPSGSVPALLGLAVEYGGVAETFSGTTVTFRTTPAKLLGAMANVYGPDVQPNDKTLLALQRLSLSVSFDTSRTSSSSTKGETQLLANYAQLSQASARLILINDRDPLAPKNWKQIRALSLATPSVNVANAALHLVQPILDMPEYESSLGQAVGVFDANTATTNHDALENAVVAFVNDMQQLVSKIPNWQNRVDTYIAARVAMDAEHKALYRRILKSPSLSLEYDFNRPPAVASSTSSSNSTSAAVSSPDLSSVGLVYVASLFDSDYTLNANANFFNSTGPTMRGNFRDLQFGAKIDIPVGKLPSFVAKGTLTFSGLYEYLHQRPLGITLTINDQAVNQPGNIGLFQAKYTIPIGDSGLQIPISFTASNRTELVKEKDVRGNIGITFDLDKLLAKK